MYDGFQCFYEIGGVINIDKFRNLVGFYGFRCWIVRWHGHFFVPFLASLSVYRYSDTISWNTMGYAS